MSDIPRAVFEELAVLLVQSRLVAQQHRLTFLAYLIEMALIEVSDQSAEEPPPGTGRLIRRTLH